MFERCSVDMLGFGGGIELIIDDLLLIIAVEVASRRCFE